MSGGIFLLQGDESLIEMREQAYDSEAVLQRLLAQYPNLLAGDQINRAEPRRWLLVAREMGVPGEEVGGDRWSLDHLFLDQEGVPTLVEVKRSADTRIRREVVGQMLDYAANAVVYWPVERLQAQFEATQAAAGQDPALALAGVIGPAGDPAQFWQTVKTNLQAGKVRLVFVADEIPAELSRVVEFLNGQMDPAEVLAIEIRQYVGQDMRTLVPRLVGQAKKLPVAAQRPSGDVWDEARFLATLGGQHGEQAAQIARQILQWARDRSLRLWWGKGQSNGSFFPMLDTTVTHWTFSVWTSAEIEIPFQHMMRQPPFDDPDKRAELLSRLRQIAGVDLPVDNITRRPNFRLLALAEPEALARFLAAYDWYIDVIRSG
jgi:hypothetical protein